MVVAKTEATDVSPSRLTSQRPRCRCGLAGRTRRPRRDARAAPAPCQVVARAHLLEEPDRLRSGCRHTRPVARRTPPGPQRVRRGSSRAHTRRRSSRPARRPAPARPRHRRAALRDTHAAQGAQRLHLVQLRSHGRRVGKDPSASLRGFVQLASGLMEFRLGDADVEQQAARVDALQHASAIGDLSAPPPGSDRGTGAPDTKRTSAMPMTTGLTP